MDADLEQRSSLLRLSLSARMARMRSAAASARSGVAKVAITASPWFSPPRLIVGDDLAEDAEVLLHDVERHCR